MSKTCLNCPKPPSEKYTPFCSKHCADVDLGNWFNGRYAAPVIEEDGGLEEDVIPEASFPHE